MPFLLKGILYRWMRGRPDGFLAERVLKGRSFASADKVGRWNLQFANGSYLPCHALFFCSEEKPRAELAIQLGATVGEDGRAQENARQMTNIPGLFVAGNNARGVQLVIVAAAEGATAAHSINEEINRENLGLSPRES